MVKPLVPKICHGCAGAILEEPPPSQLKAYPNRGKFCSIDCAQKGELKECTRCSTWFRAYMGNGKLCEVCRQKPYLDFDGVKRKAWSLGANIIGGKGKTEWMIGFINEALNTPCTYCGVTLTLGNISLDHKEPIGSVQARRKKADNLEIRAHADRRDNLQLICRGCNGLKSDFTSTEFAELLEFSRSWSGGDKLMKRLARSLKVWSGKYK